MDLVYDKESQLAVAWIQPAYPNGVIVSYDVLYHPVSSSNPFEIATVYGQSSGTVLEGLTAYTNYTVRVLLYIYECKRVGNLVSFVKIRAKTIMQGNYSEAVTGRTDEGSRHA